MKWYWWLILGAVLYLITGQVDADVLHLKSGQTLEGKVVNETDKAVTLEVQSGSLTIPRDLIERIERKKSRLAIYAEKLAMAKTSADFEALVEWCTAQSLDTRTAREKLRDARASEKRAANPQTYCRKCRAHGDRECTDCKGIGKVMMPCKICHRTGKVACQLCDGKGAVACDRCRKTGNVTVSCRRCKGTGIAKCSRCGGRGKIKPRSRTRRLGGDKRDPKRRDDPEWIICPKCDDDWRRRSFDCPSCGKTGKVVVTCPSCSGKGTVQCLRCGTSGQQVCSACKGQGEVEVICIPCEGKGRVTCEACSGTGIMPKAAIDRLPGSSPKSR